MRRSTAMPDSKATALDRRLTDRRVLLVEDVAAMRLYLGYALERHGVQISEAGDLETARQLLRTGLRPTSVLLDLELPDGNGLELLPDLPPGTPVAALTGDDSSETARRCREAGCQLVLSKSSRLGDIGEVLEKIERDWRMEPLPARHEPALADRYFNYLVESLQELRQAASRRDLGSVRRIGHRLRGTAVHFGYGSIGACAGELGKAIASGNTRVIDSTLDTLLERLSAAVGAPAAGTQPPGTTTD
jgi:CheY-like chemotaxis protein